MEYTIDTTCVNLHWEVAFNLAHVVLVHGPLLIITGLINRL
jgi:hypothetical protein